jgi:DNA-binding transcriptional LysR family regulator
MHLPAIKVFCDVVRLRSFSTAALENDITQSAVSQHVLKLEKQLGAALLDRSVRPFILTPEGNIFYDGCRGLVERYYAVESAVRNLRNDLSGSISVAAIYSIGITDMSKFIAEFAEQYPKVKIAVSYLHPEKIYDRVQRDEVDFGLMSYPERRPGTAIIPWKAQSMVLVSAPSHPLAGKARLRPRDLDGHNFISFERGLAIRREINRFLKRHEVHVHQTLEFDNIEAVKHAIEVGEGISILPEPTVAAEVKAGLLSTARFLNATLERTLGIVRRDGKVLSPAAERFIEFILKSAPQRSKRSQAA